MKHEDKWEKILSSESGKLGYLLAWLMGVPASILVIIFLLRGG
jgi:hypothetical protein